MIGEIRVGTASWTDPEFVREWYPKDVKAKDRLAWYAAHFKTVEVNSGFYAIPEPHSAELWAAQTPADFVFTIKLFKGLSGHSTEAKALPPRLRHLAHDAGGRVEITPDLRDGLIEETLDAVKPLLIAGKLGAVLLQLSPSFSPKHGRLDDLLPIADAFRDIGLAIELRNRNWLTTDIAPAVIDWYEKHGVAFVNVDAPRTEHFTIMPPSEFVTTDCFAYIRLHGRNADAYLKGKTVAERFDYKYSPEEIAETVDEARNLAEEAKRVIVIYNNNHGNYAPVAAGVFQNQLGTGTV